MKKKSMAGVVTDRGHDLELVMLQTLIPPNCSLNVDIVLHWRYIGEMPSKKTAPRIVTKSWNPAKNPEETESAAAKHVIRELWNWNGKAVCPHDLDALF